MISLEHSIETPPTRSVRDGGGDSTQRFVVPAASQLGDFELLRELGRGGFGVVYAARHVRRRNLVALKTLPLGQDNHGIGNADRLHKFRCEFRSLADVNHPNLVGMQTLEVDDGQWFFTMDLIAGEDFISYVRPEGTLDEKRLRATLPQLAGGIMALHAQHIIHRDLNTRDKSVARFSNRPWPPLIRPTVQIKLTRGISTIRQCHCNYPQRIGSGDYELIRELGRGGIGGHTAGTIPAACTARYCRVSQHFTICLMLQCACPHKVSVSRRR